MGAGICQFAKQHFSHCDCDSEMRMGQDCKGDQNNGAEIGRMRFALIFDWEIGLGPSPLQRSLCFSPVLIQIKFIRLDYDFYHVF
jgi:hypothetical protein